MYVPFNEIEDSARVWIYQSVRKFNEAERDTISKTLLSYTEQWAAHGNPLKTSFELFYDQFVVLAADENFEQASGCSIDGAVRVVQDIDRQFGLSLFDRTKVAFHGDPIRVVGLGDLTKSLEQGIWKPDSLVFNNVLNTKGELSDKWILPAKETWLKRYLTKVAV